MTRQEVRERIAAIGIIPAVRLHSESEALFAAEAVCASGIPIVEVTMTIPNAVAVIRDLTRYRTDIIVGAGTVVDVETARACLDAGAGFLTSPGLDHEIVEFALRCDVVVIPGALTPSEVMAVWKTGADFVKVFPCAQVGGPDYIRALKAPFPKVPLIAAGGVNQKNATEYILAGAAALGIGQHLIHQNAIKRRQREWIHELARRYLGMLAEARTGQVQQSGFWR
jgi:2-dehydro-3-deoxyphosphogluconate aldolase/(4S)-4-hydroxy-2-oxoglutarate aldolase